MGRGAVSPWETSNTLQSCDQPAPWLSADSSLTAPLRLLHTHTHTQALFVCFFFLKLFLVSTARKVRQGEFICKAPFRPVAITVLR